ncbi:hypothetical protein JSY14_01775 [Brachybacterium sp. EF45031]|uniref:DUF6318 family protein n=1 Tax=Brachybacterium sillae TaxID=2810536 RepID=UPI00217ED446|nr:DUF6318 family protein [Brachybacterium sillae]MCS6710810.1 hypothetical protein [Brachybacterium sillae]
MPPLSVETTTAAVSAQETPLPTWADRRRPGGVRRLGAVALAGVVMLGVAACGGEGSRDAATFPPTVVSDFPVTSDGGGETTPGAPSDGGGTTDGGASDGGGTVVANIPKPDPKDYPGMDQHTQEGAEQAFRFYVDAMSWTRRTGDGSLMRDMSAADCTGCHDLIERFESMRSEAAVSATVDLEVVNVDTQESDVAEYIVSGTLRPKEGADSATSGSADDDSSEAAAALEWIDGEWVVGELGIQSNDPLQGD